MSFSSEAKKFLSDLDRFKWDCCKEAFRKGTLGQGFEYKCKKCNKAYISGIFCSFGTVAHPSKGFQLYLYIPEESEGFVNKAVDKALAFKKGAVKGKNCLYLKSCDDVAGFFAACDASSFALRVMDAGIKRQEKGHQQRLTNAEVANIDRASTAAADQLNAIKIIREAGKFNQLKKEYRETALMREENIDLSLEELAVLFSPPITKSGLNHRLKKIISIAEEIVKYKEV